MVNAFVEFGDAGAREPALSHAAGDEIGLNAEVGEPGRPSESECKAYEGRIIDRLRAAGCDGVQIYDGVCPDRQLANWHSRPGMSCDSYEFMTFWIGDVDFYVTVQCTPAGRGSGDAYVVSPMDELEAGYVNDDDVESAVPDGLVIRASYDLDAYHDGDREYIQSFDRLDELVDFIASDGFVGRVMRALGIAEMTEELAGDSGAEETRKEAELDVEGLPSDELLNMAIYIADAMSGYYNQYGCVYTVNLSGLYRVVKDIYYDDVDVLEYPLHARDISNTTLEAITRVLPPEFDAVAAKCVSYCQNHAPHLSSRAVALSNGSESIIVCCNMVFREQKNPIRFASTRDLDNLLIAILPQMFPGDYGYGLRRQAARCLGLSDGAVRECNAVSDVLRTGILKVPGSTGGTMWTAEEIEHARKVLDLEPLDFPLDIEVRFVKKTHSVNSITKVDALAKRVHSVEFPDGVTTIGVDALIRMPHLRKVYLPSTLACDASFIHPESLTSGKLVVALECDERCEMAERMRNAAAIWQGQRDLETKICLRFGVTREEFRAIPLYEELGDSEEQNRESEPELELIDGEPGGSQYGRYVHEGDSDSLVTVASEAAADALISRFRDERAWVLSYSDGYYEGDELDGSDYGGRRVMTYDEAVEAWQNYPLEDDLEAALGEGGCEDEHYELHILLNYADGLDRNDSDDDDDWEWDCLITVADRYALYDPDED